MNEIHFNNSSPERSSTAPNQHQADSLRSEAKGPQKFSKQEPNSSLIHTINQVAQILRTELKTPEHKQKKETPNH